MTENNKSSNSINVRNSKNTGKELVEQALKNKKGEFLTYEDMPNVLMELGIIDEKTDIPKLILNLRNGMSELTGEQNNNSNYLIETTTTGKIKSFKLVDKPMSQRKAEVIEVIEKNDFSSMQTLARRLMRDRRMPFYGIYLPLRAVSRWVRYSEEDEEASETKRKYEGRKCEELLKEWLLKSKKQDKILSIIGLGIGEGVGEIELIERLLKQGFKIHYCAIDMNPFLLMDHATRLKYKFEREIKNGELVCSVVADNFLKNFSNIVEKVRTKVEEKKITDDFIPKDSNVLVSILGNVLGNLENRASEGVYFKTIRDEFESQNIAFLLGVGVLHEDEAPYKLDDLFLATPRYLTHELGILKSSLKTEKRDSKEFYIDSEERFQIKNADYQGDGLVHDENAHVKGKIYEFLYTTKGELKMEVEDGQFLTLPPETKLLLYNIIKFDLKKLFGFLEFKGLKIPHRDKTPHKDIEILNVGTEAEKRLYAVFAVTT